MSPPEGVSLAVVAGAGVATVLFLTAAALVGGVLALRSARQAKGGGKGVFWIEKSCWFLTEKCLQTQNILALWHMVVLKREVADTIFRHHQTRHHKTEILFGVTLFDMRNCKQNRTFLVVFHDTPVLFMLQKILFGGISPYTRSFYLSKDFIWWYFTTYTFFLCSKRF